MSDEKKDGGGEEAKAGEGGCVADPPKEVEVGAGPPPAPIDISGGLQHHVVPTERCGALNVYVEGDLQSAYKEKDSKCVFLCAHDVGCNHRSIKKFINHPAFDEIKRRVVVIYVDLPGHENGASDLTIQFPTIQQIGEDLVTVLDQLRVKYVIGIGDGAGANIMARFGMMHKTRCMGVILLHPTSNKTTMTKNFKTKFSKITPSGENLAIFRKFGHKIENLEGQEQEAALEHYKTMFGADINKKNSKMYVQAYQDRRDITPELTKMTCDALLVVGSKTSHVSSAEHMHQCMDKTRSSILKIDDVGDVLVDAPMKLSNCILLFCKGLGWLTSVNLPGVERRRSTDADGKPTRTRSISMEDYDKPNIRRLSISSKD